MKLVYSSIIVIIGIFLIFTIGFQNAGDELIASEHTNLDESTIVYISSYNQWGNTNNNLTEIETSTSFVGEQANVTGEKTSDFAQEYLDMKQTADQSKGFLTKLSSIPEFIITGMGLNVETWQEYKLIINIVIGLSIFGAIILFIRGVL